jgi:hypothetical protein
MLVWAHFSRWFLNVALWSIPSVWVGGLRVFDGGGTQAQLLLLLATVVCTPLLVLCVQFLRTTPFWCDFFLEFLSLARLSLAPSWPTCGRERRGLLVDLLALPKSPAQEILVVLVLTFGMSVVVWWFSLCWFGFVLMPCGGAAQA